MLHSKPVLSRVARDPGALDEFHYQVGSAVFSGPAVEQPGDVGVLQPGQNLALPTETAKDEICIQALAHQLDGHLGEVLIVGADSEPNGSHPTSAEFTD